MNSEVMEREQNLLKMYTRNAHDEAHRQIKRPGPAQNAAGPVLLQRRKKGPSGAGQSAERSCLPGPGGTPRGRALRGCICAPITSDTMNATDSLIWAGDIIPGARVRASMKKCLKRKDLVYNFGITKT